MRIRRCSDEFILTDLQRRCLPSDDPLDPRIGDWWVCWDGAEAVAFACLRVSSFNEGYLARAGVLPVARGKGLQKRLIRIRERRARKLGMSWVITDTHRTNFASSNSLAACGYRLYDPAYRWAFADGNYWRKKL